MKEQTPLTPLRAHVVALLQDAGLTKQLRRMLLEDSVLTAVHSMDEAISLIRDEGCDLVLTDYDPECLLPLRTACPSAEYMPVIMLAPEAQSEQIVEALYRGADECLPWPLEPKLLKARIRSQIAQKRRFDAQQATISHLQEAHEQKDRFLRIATHDLKNPLTSIRIANYYLRQTVGDQPEVSEALETIEMTVNTMNDLIVDFLDTSALEAGKANIRLEAVEVENIVWDVLNRYGTTAGKKNITLMMGNSRGVIHADPNRMLQVLGNLVSNAIKFSPEDCFITVDTQACGDFIRFSVVDEGPGIKPEDQQKLFQAFNKASTRPTADEHSSGLGLWIVKELVGLQGGRVGVECPPLGGSTFWVELPVYTPYVAEVAV
jgi:signal transduction histidine kinase